MKTKSLMKAPIGSVKVVIDAQQEGYMSYDELNELNVSNHENNVKLILENQEHIEVLKNEVTGLREEVGLLRKTIEDTLKGLIMR